MSHRYQVYVPAGARAPAAGRSLGAIRRHAERWPVMVVFPQAPPDQRWHVLSTDPGCSRRRAAGPKQAWSRRPGARRLIAGALVACASGCDAGHERPAEPELHRERVALGASFVGGRAAGLRQLLHADLIVQPPAPDTALRGSAAADYLERLARESQLTGSELFPVSVSREGGFLLERGGWHLESGAGTFASRYMLRWRESPAGWKVVLWRWTLFR